MFSPRWRKVIQDLWSNRTRTVLVVLSIAVGVFAVGMTLSTREVLTVDLRESYLAINPSDAVIYTDPFDSNLVEVVKRVDGVAAAEGRRVFNSRLKVGPDSWRDISVYAVDDYDEMQINVIRPEEGQLAPAAEGPPARTDVREPGSRDRYRGPGYPEDAVGQGTGASYRRKRARPQWYPG